MLPTDIIHHIAHYLNFPNICNLQLLNRQFYVALKNDLFWMTKLKMDYPLKFKTNDSWYISYEYHYYPKLFARDKGYYGQIAGIDFIEKKLHFQNKNITQIACGDSHAAIIIDKKLITWGDNNNGPGGLIQHT